MGFNPQRGGYKLITPDCIYLTIAMVSIPKGEATNFSALPKLASHNTVSIPKGEATNRLRREREKYKDYKFQSPKGRLQT